MHVQRSGQKPTEGNRASFRQPLDGGPNTLGVLCEMADAASISLLHLYWGKPADLVDGLLIYTGVWKTRARIKKQEACISLCHWIIVQSCSGSICRPLPGEEAWCGGTWPSWLLLALVHHTGHSRRWELHLGSGTAHQGKQDYSSGTG